jgi:hypothetical protein
MFQFKEFVGVDAELMPFVTRLKQGVRFSTGEGYVSITFPKIADEMAAPTPMRLAASVVHPGDLVEITQKGWKGPAATGAIAGQIGHWKPAEKASFEKAMDAGKKSLPSVVGKEMGLLFEIEVFLYLLNTHKLSPVGTMNLASATAEKTRLEGEIATKLKDPNLGKLVCEFIRIHAGGGSGGMGELIFQKSSALIRACIIDSIEFLGGAGWGAGAGKLKSDTADLRLICSSAAGADRSSLGFSLKAVTETQIEVRSFGLGKSYALLGGKNIKALKDILTNPLYEDSERPELVLSMFEKAARRNAGPRRFAKLLELLVTGGAETLPAYRMLVRNIGEPGWSGAIGKDFGTSEAPGVGKLAAQSGAKIDVKKTKTYVSLTYMVPGGNHYGTSIKFEPSVDLSKVSVYVSNLVSRGGRGW